MSERILDSIVTKILAIVIGLLSGIASLIAYAFPNPEVVSTFSRIGLFLVSIYVLILLLQRLVLLSDRQTTYLFTSKRYGIGYDSLRIECIVNEDGSAIVQRTVDVKAFSNLSKLDVFLLIPEKKEDSSTQETIDLSKVKSLTPNRIVSVDKSKKNSHELSAIIDIAPPLTEGEHVTYEMIEQLPPKLYAINLNDLEIYQRKTPYDYFGWSINRPTRKLYLNVFFPEFFVPHDYGVEVRYASASNFPSETLHHKEMEFIKKSLKTTGPEGGRYALRLDIDDPMIGLIYLIRWQPLHKDW